MNENVALITGASSGIGRAAATAFAAKGASVVLAARRQDELDSLVAEIEAVGGKATAIKTDVSKAQDVEQMMAHALATFGRLDYAVNNAGIEGRIANIVDLPEHDWDKVLDINLKGNYLCLRYEARAMIYEGRGVRLLRRKTSFKLTSFIALPGFDTLRDDPRFEKLTRRLGLPETAK